MSRRAQMEWVFVALILAAFAYEFIALANARPGDTISEIVWTISAKRPLLPFLVGVLCGHFFWQRVP